MSNIATAMKTAGFLALVLGAALLSAQDSQPATRPAGARLTRDQMVADLDFLEAAVRDKWSYLEDKEKNFGVDLKALVARAKEQLREELTKAEFHDVVLELVAGLKDGHAAVFTLGVPRPALRWPFRIADTPEGFVVVEQRGEHGPGLGAIVFADVGGSSATIEERLAALERTTLASTDRVRPMHALRRLHETDSRIVSVGFMAPGTTSRQWVSLETVDPYAPESRPSARTPVWSAEVLPGGVAKLRVRSFAVEDWTGWLAAKPESREAILVDTKAIIDECFRKMAGSKAAVIDLRGNQGGTDLLGIHLAKHLLPKRFVYYMLSAKLKGKWTPPHGYEHDPFPADQRFDGPLAILIDEDCFSVTDNFLRAIIENRDDVIVVGRPTNGGTGAPGTIAKLPASETFVTLCTMRVYGPKGTMIESRGTVPAIPVRWTAADHLERRDPDLEAALEALRRAESGPAK